MSKTLKYKLVLFFILAASVVKSQILLPNFEAPQRLEILSTESEEIAPIPFSNGQNLYFVRSVPEGKAKERKAGQEIWTAERTGDTWSEPKNVFKEANDLGNNGVIGSSVDGNKIYVFNSIQSRRKLARGIAYVEKQDDGTWGELKKLKIEGFEIGEGYYSFYMNQTEDVLLISMAPNEATINEDLFVSTKNLEGKWSAVKSLGAKINTTGVELSPFITEDKSALYFASNGHGGEGDVDIFVSYRLGEGWNNWTTPKNLGPQINSKSFDGYFMIGNNKEVFFVSNRDSAMGDVYISKLVEAKSVRMASNEVNGQFLYKGLPSENVKLEVYDEGGNLMDTVITDQFGKFSYQKLNSDQIYFLKVAAIDASDYTDAVYYELDKDGQKSSRYVLTKTGLFVNASKIKDDENVVGTFTYNDLPLENSYLLVYNENGDAIDTIITDASGNFVYKKLDANANYTFKPLDVTSSEDVIVDINDQILNVKGSFKYKNLPLQNEALLVLDENGDIIDTIYTDSQGNFNYKKLSADNNYSFKPADYKDDELALGFTLQEPEESVIEGTMKYKKLPLINTPLLVKDENGIVIDTVYTDVNGKFNFKKLKADGKYSFEAVNQENDPDLIEFDLTEIEKEQVQGSFKYKNLPLQNEALVILDENGFPVDTIYTDESGSFKYEKLKGETNYTIKLLNYEDVDVDDLILDFANAENLAKNEQIKGSFKYKNLPMQNTALVVFDENGFPVDTIYTDENGRFQYEKLKGDMNYSFKLLDENEISMDDLVLRMEKGSQLSVESKSNRSVSNQNKFTLSSSIYFNFNEVVLSSEDYSILDQIVKNKAKIKNIILEGHTDNIGSDEINLKISNLRIESTVKYLIKKGVNPKIIKQVAFGEKNPVGDNTNSKGRSVNRRVSFSCN